MGNRTKPAAFISGVKQEAKLNPFQKHELAQRVIEHILAGDSRSKLIPIVKQYTPVQLSETGVTNVIEYAQQWLQENVQLEANIIVDIHTIWYEKIYQYFKSIGHVRGMNKAMKGKEKLAGMHREVIKVDKKTTINVLPAAEYDLTSLTPEEQIRFEFLLNKAST